MRTYQDGEVKIISLGWGVQSMTIAVMAALGDIEPVDYAIHSDTTHERTDTYIYAERWTRWLEDRGLRVVTVKLNNPKRQDPVYFSSYGQAFIPAFTNNPEGTIGQLRRQCTSEWKIVPLRRWLQANRNGQPVEQWLGISLDEVQRMKPSNVKYITNRDPLIERKMSRHSERL